MPSADPFSAEIVPNANSRSEQDTKYYLAENSTVLEGHIGAYIPIDRSPEDGTNAAIN